MLFLVTTPDLSCAMRCKRLMGAMGRLNYPQEKFHGILNKFKPVDYDFLKVYKETVNGDWFTVVADQESTEKAIREEKFLSGVAPKENIVKNIEHIALHIAGEDKENMEKGGIFSWLGKIFTS